MKLVKNDPMSLLDRMKNDINEFFHQNEHRHFPAFFSDLENWPGLDWRPSVDIKDEDKQYVITVDVPGVDAKDIDVTYDNGLLRISGERKSEKEEKKKDFRLKECSYGSFERAVRLPGAIDGDKIKAKGKNGVLTVTVAKKAGESTRKIAIES